MTSKSEASAWFDRSIAPEEEELMRVEERVHEAKSVTSKSDVFHTHKLVSSLSSSSSF